MYDEFVAKEDFKHGIHSFESGNKYTAKKYGVTEDDVHLFHECGWVSLDGQEDCVRNPNKAVLVPSQIKSKPGVQGD